MYSIENILNFRYWFSEPTYQSPLAMKVVLIFFAIMLATAVVLTILSQKEKFEQYVRRLFGKIALLLGWLGALAMLLSFFRYEATPFLARRFWFGLWCAGFIVWMFFILRYWLKEVPRKRREQVARERLKKYLP